MDTVFKLQKRIIAYFVTVVNKLKRIIINPDEE